MPGLKHVGSRGNLIDFKCSGGIGNGEVRICHDADVCVHPVMNVAFQMKHDLFILRLEIKDVSRCRLTDVEAVVLAGQTMGIVKE